MIEAKDLRRGNFLMYDKKLIYVSSILKDECIGMYDGYGLDKSTPLECCKPIPVTKEWLLRFGFKKKSEYVLEYNKFVLAVHNEDKLIMRGINFDVFVYHVHQLQNLYHALTREELILKP